MKDESTIMYRCRFFLVSVSVSFSLSVERIQKVKSEENSVRWFVSIIHYVFRRARGKVNPKLLNDVGTLMCI